jgi:uncharacterized coiled-coil protein SlyX
MERFCRIVVQITLLGGWMCALAACRGAGPETSRANDTTSAFTPNSTDPSDNQHPASRLDVWPGDPGIESGDRSKLAFEEQIRLQEKTIRQLAEINTLHQRILRRFLLRRHLELIRMRLQDPDMQNNKSGDK